MDRPQAIRKGYDMTDASEAKNPQEEYDIRCETAASRNMLERRMVVIYLTQVATTCSIAGYGGIPAEPKRV